MQSYKDGVFGDVEPLDFEKALREQTEEQIDGIEILATETEKKEGKKREGFPISEMNRNQLKKAFGVK